MPGQCWAAPEPALRLPTLSSPYPTAYSSQERGADGGGNELWQTRILLHSMATKHSRWAVFGTTFENPNE